ncbi:MAG TPA: cytochrome c3 family protein [Anaeromyxobacter sp.]
MSAPGARCRAAALVAPLLACLVPLTSAASGGAYAQTRHGDPVRGVLRVPTAPRGSCMHCHDSRSPGGRRVKVRCQDCHSAPSQLGVYPGAGVYSRSVHGSSWAVWPESDRRRKPRDGGDCANCHDPHGRSDAAGLVPALARVREEGLCLGCHTGSPGKDLRPQPGQIYGHPWAAVSGKHVAGERGPDASQPGAPAARHAECVDCHNPHAARRDAVRPLPPEAPGALLGVARVRVSNGAAGAAPTFSYAGPDDTSPPREHELCFRCHSSYAVQRPGAKDLAVAFNPANASTHPVEARGTNPGIALGAFTSGWSADRTVLCSDCHAGDTGLRGPHASSYRYLLKARYVAEAGRRPVAPDDLCFGCHAFAPYADPMAGPATLSQSRFNPPNSAAGHAFHVATQGLGCWACHETHGSPSTPNLIAAGRPGGIAAFAREASGGSCTTTCHAPKAYGLNYPR